MSGHAILLLVTLCMNSGAIGFIAAVMQQVPRFRLLGGALIAANLLYLVVNFIRLSKGLVT